MKRSRIVLLLLFLFLLLMSAAILLLHQSLLIASEPEPEPVVAHVVERGQSSYQICADKNDRSALAAARYLEHALSARTGVSLPIVAPADAETAPTITLRSDTSGAEGGNYIISLDEDANIVFTLPAPDTAFACAKALVDRWLSTDCGLQGDALLLDQSLIDNGFSGLTFHLDGTLRILSQNIRKKDDPDGNAITERAPRFSKLVSNYAPDVIGMQEVSEPWLDVLQTEYAAQYEIYGCSQYGQDSAEGFGNYILFRRDRFLFLNGGTFWLSATPEAEGSIFDDYLGSPRCCTWVLLKDSATGRLFYLENTHLHNGRTVDAIGFRTQQMQILLSTIEMQYAKYGDYPVFLIGDFNMLPIDELYLDVSQLYRNAAAEALADTSDINYTFHNYGTQERLYDFCFYRGENLVILNSRIASDNYDGYVSDHYGLLTDVYLY